MDEGNLAKVKSQMHSLAFGQAMQAAAENYKKELLDAELNASNTDHHRDVDIDDLLNDPDLERLHAERLAMLQQEAEKRVQLQQKGHGAYEEVPEADFLEIVTKTPLVVAHFFHRDFQRCKIIDKHLSTLAPTHFDTRFIKISAPDAPFFTEKLQVKMLPCIICFVDGVAVDRVVGFAEFGEKDDFPTSRVLSRLVASGAVLKPKKKEYDSDDEDTTRRTLRSGGSQIRKTESDEDSDFD